MQVKTDAKTHFRRFDTFTHLFFVHFNSLFILLFPLAKNLAPRKLGERDEQFNYSIKLFAYGYVVYLNRNELRAKVGNYNALEVDLTAWAGHKVNFEIVVVTNFGEEFVAVQANNVTVPSLIEAPNYVITASKLAGNTERTGLTYALDESGEFVTYTQKTDGSSDCYAYITFPNANINVPTDPTGQYVIIKYRTTYDDRIEIFAGANNGSTTAKGSVDNFSLTQKADGTGSLIADGEWHCVILALHDIIGGFNKPTNAFAPEDGTEDTYILDYLRLDFFNSASTTARTVDVAFVAYADSVEKLVNYAGVDSYTYVYGYSGGVLYETVEVE